MPTTRPIGASTSATTTTSLTTKLTPALWYALLATMPTGDHLMATNVSKIVTIQEDFLSETTMSGSASTSALLGLDMQTSWPAHPLSTSMTPFPVTLGALATVLILILPTTTPIPVSVW